MNKCHRHKLLYASNTYVHRKINDNLCVKQELHLDFLLNVNTQEVMDTLYLTYI